MPCSKEELRRKLWDLMWLLLEIASNLKSKIVAIIIIVTAVPNCSCRGHVLKRRVNDMNFTTQCF